MYAIIRTGGHQEKVTAGEQITVDRLRQAEGDEVTFVPLMVSRDDGSVVSDRKVLETEAKVVGRVLQHVKGDKIDVFQYRQKTGYRRHTGHRQPLTLVEITEIRFGADVARAPEPAAEPEPAPAPEATPAETPAATKKPAVKKAAPKKAAPKKAKAGTNKGT